MPKSSAESTAYHQEQIKLLQQRIQDARDYLKLQSLSSSQSSNSDTAQRLEELHARMPKGKTPEQIIDDSKKQLEVHQKALQESPSYNPAKTAHFTPPPSSPVKSQYPASKSASSGNKIRRSDNIGSFHTVPKNKI